MARVFISYRREKVEEVTDLAKSIELSHHVWFDRLNAESLPWWDTILQQILNCDVFIAVYDPEYESSWYCLNELEYANSLGKTLMPVFL